MSEPSSDSPADDEQDKPGLLDRILGRSGGGAHRDEGEDRSDHDEQEDPSAAAEDEEPHEGGDETPDDGSSDDGGEPSVGAMPAAEEVDQDAIEEERATRLDPENRPDNVEIDNTQRDFDSEKGMFTDAEGYEDAEKKYDDDAF